MFPGTTGGALYSRFVAIGIVVAKMMHPVAGFESIPLDSPDESTDSDWVEVDPRYDAPNTPSSTGDEAPRRESVDAEREEEENARSQGELVPRRKPGGYDSRVEQMLYENPELPILITEAGKSSESGRYIVYTIKTGVSLIPPPWPGFSAISY